MTEPEDAGEMVERCRRGQPTEYVHPFSVLMPADWRAVCGYGEETTTGFTRDPIPEEPMGPGS